MKLNINLKRRKERRTKRRRHRKLKKEDNNSKMKVMEEETYYKVKWVGSTKQTWEPEDNLFGAQDAIDNFLLEEKSRISMLEKMKKEREESGEYEVARILEVANPENARKREFLVRWKLCGPDDDTWEPEENLNCPELIEKFMEKWERR